MGGLQGIYALWYREIKVFSRERSRLAASIASPLLWLLVIGGGFGSVIRFGSTGYLAFLFPGILVQLVLFSAVFFGVYIVWDKKIDFLKEVLVSPLSRTAVFCGKILGGSTDTLVQLAVLLSCGYIFSAAGIMGHLDYSPPSLALAVVFLLVTTAGFASVGLIIGSQAESPTGFQLIGSFLVTPLFFLSGALFPITNLPGWLMPFVLANPATYAVDGVRGVLVGVHQFAIGTDLAVTCLFAAAMVLAGGYAFRHIRL